eukprot:scaffold22390_cov28-Tisochrysis_lutea.AAC.4
MAARRRRGGGERRSAAGEPQRMRGRLERRWSIRPRAPSRGSRRQGRRCARGRRDRRLATATHLPLEI